jgi:hypothetical protein
MPWPRTLSLFACVALIGCGAAGLQDGVYRGPNYAFRVGPTPPSWQQLSADHAALAFRNPADEATIGVNARCGTEAEDVPLGSLTQHLFIRFTERQIERQEVVPFDKREAMHTILEAKLDGVKLKFDVWVLKKDGCIYDLMYMAPPDRYGRGSQEFSRFVSGFSTVQP